MDLRLAPKMGQLGRRQEESALLYRRDPLHSGTRRLLLVIPSVPAVGAHQLHLVALLAATLRVLGAGSEFWSLPWLVLP